MKVNGKSYKVFEVLFGVKYNFFFAFRIYKPCDQNNTQNECKQTKNFRFNLEKNNSEKLSSLSFTGVKVLSYDFACIRPGR